MWGNDYPHKESSFPYSHEALRLSVAGGPDREVQQMIGANAARLYGFDLDDLAAVAARVGPTVEELAAPIAPADIPIDARRCPAFAGIENTN
jgi:hypothetical protein